jgi:hypothetical protein
MNNSDNNERFEIMSILFQSVNAASLILHKDVVTDNETLKLAGEVAISALKTLNFQVGGIARAWNPNAIEKAPEGLKISR